jgi:hypothetical protein
MNSHFSFSTILNTIFIFSYITVPTKIDFAAAHTATFGTLLDYNTYSRVEGEFTVYTHITLARGVKGGSHGDHGEEEEHHDDRRRLSHFWTDLKWENSNCSAVISG